MLTKDELKEQIDQLRRTHPVGSLWRHRRGGTYRIVDHGFDTGTDLPAIIYRDESMEEHGVNFIRTAKDWDSVEGSDRKFVPIT